MPDYIGDLGTLIDLAGASGSAAIPLGPADHYVKTLEIGNASRVVFYVHAERDAATAIDTIELILQVGPDGSRWSPIRPRSVLDEALVATPLLIQPAVGGSLDLVLYTEAARGTPYARLLTRANGAGPVKAGDKINVRGSFW